MGMGVWESCLHGLLVSVSVVRLAIADLYILSLRIRSR